MPRLSSVFGAKRAPPAPESPQHLHHLRHRRVRWPSVHGHGAARGPDAEASHRRKTHRDVGAARNRHSDCRRPGCRARQRHRSSRHQAGEYFSGGSRAGKNSGFRAGQAGHSAANVERSLSAQASMRTQTHLVGDDISDQSRAAPSAPWCTCRRNRLAAKNWIRARIYFRWAWCSTKWPPEWCPSPARPSR